jgi:hypothetical protein
MSILVEPTKNKRKFHRAYVPKTALAKGVKFIKETMEVSFTDGRILRVPIIWFPLLQEATPDQREKYEIGGGGLSLHWPELDEDLSVAYLLAGGDLQSA